jgi:hypothetical protein
MRRRHDDPYFDRKVYHKAAKINANGDVSALCYKRPRRIPLERGQSYVMFAGEVTCPRCRKILSTRQAGPHGDEFGPSKP